MLAENLGKEARKEVGLQVRESVRKNVDDI